MQTTIECYIDKWGELSHLTKFKSYICRDWMERSLTDYFELDTQKSILMHLSTVKPENCQFVTIYRKYHAGYPHINSDEFPVVTVYYNYNYKYNLKCLLMDSLINELTNLGWDDNTPIYMSLTSK